MSIHKLAEAKSDKLSDLDLPISALYLLAAPSTPAPARDEILERAEAGEKIKHAEVKQAIAEAKPEWTKSLRDRRRPPPPEFDLRIVHEPMTIFRPGSTGNAYKSNDIKGRKPARRRSNSKSRDVGTCGPFLSEAVAFTDAVNSSGGRTSAAVFPPAAIRHPCTSAGANWRTRKRYAPARAQEHPTGIRDRGGAQANFRCRR